MMTLAIRVALGASWGVSVGVLVTETPRCSAGAVGSLGRARSPVFAIAEPPGTGRHAHRQVGLVLGTGSIQDTSIDPGGYVHLNGWRLDGWRLDDRAAFDGPTQGIVQ